LKTQENLIKMENEDHLKEILKCINQVNGPIDVESEVLQKIREYEKYKDKIAKYKANHIKALVMSGVLIMVLVLLFSLPSNIRTVEYSVSTYVLVLIVLIVIFIQLEMTHVKLFKNLK